VRAALDTYFAANERARGYVLDDQGRLRPHMAIFIDGNHIQDRDGLSVQSPPARLSTVCRRSRASPHAKALARRVGPAGWAISRVSFVGDHCTLSLYDPRNGP